MALIYRYCNFFPHTTEQTFDLLCTFLNGNDIMSLRENQVTPKEAFGSPGSLTGKYPAKQDEEHEVRIFE